MLLKQATDIAIGYWKLLKPHCTICKIAGSIRREKPEVKDIEIVALPKFDETTDLFGNVTGKVRSAAWINSVAGLGTVVKGKADGKYMQIQLPEGINLDLFMPDDFDYWRQYAIRTGSADWTARFIAGGWKNIGWCGSDVGLRMQSQCEGIKGPDGKMKWKCTQPKHQQILPPHWNSEEEFFAWIKLPWVEPKNRNI